MNKEFEYLKARVIEAVLENDVNKLGSVCDRKDVMMAIAKRIDKQASTDILGLSNVTCHVDRKEYSLIGLAIKNANATILRMLGYLGCNPLMPAYKERGQEVSVLSYLKQRTEGVEGDWDLSLDMGEVNFAVYNNRCLKITPEQMLENFKKHGNNELSDAKLLETIFFYPYNIHECPYEFEVTTTKGKKEETRAYYPFEYLLVNKCRNLVPDNDKVHKYDEKTMVPYHGVDKEMLMDKSYRAVNDYNPGSGRFLIDNKDPNFVGVYPMLRVVESVLNERKCLEIIERLKPKMDWARADYKPKK